MKMGRESIGSESASRKKSYAYDTQSRVYTYLQEPHGVTGG